MFGPRVKYFHYGPLARRLGNDIRRCRICWDHCSQHVGGVVRIPSNGPLPYVICRELAYDQNETKPRDPRTSNKDPGPEDG